MISRRQQGLATVEFAIVASLVLTMIFGVIEVARAYYVYSMLDDVARRGARLAAVCPVNDPAVPRLAIYNNSGNAGNSPLVKDLTPEHVVIEYLDAGNNIVATPANPASFVQIRYVRARIVGFEHLAVLPWLLGTTGIQMPEFVSTLPRESLGIPREGAITPC
jgi:hypothetical protein